MEVFCGGDTFCLRSGGLTIDGISAFVEYAGDHYDVPKIRSGRWEKTLLPDGCVRVSDGRFSLRLSEREGKIFAVGAFRADRAFCGVRFCFLKGRADRRFTKVFANGGTPFNSLNVCEMQAPVGVYALLKEERKESLDFAVGISEKGCLAAGAAAYKENFSAVCLSEGGETELSVPLYGRPIAEGEEILSEEFVLFEKEDLQGALCGLAEIAAETGGKREFSGGSRSGWCSWYYYGNNISEEIILENAAELKRRNVPVGYIQVDDGWSGKRGDWEANGRFPHGMKWLADRIREMGFLPGIWVAPLTAESDSAFFAAHRDLFVKEYGGDGVFGWNSLDLSQPEAQKFLYDLFRKLSSEWGYRYIKFDFAAFGLSAGRHADSSYNGLKNYRKALEIMRSAVTEDTFLLACTSPMLAPIGFADGVRISKDIFERWESLREVAAQVLHRLWLGRSIRVDPDCLMLRTAAEEEGDCFRLCTRTEAEIDTFLALVAVSGGTVMLSDKVRLLPDSRLDKFRALLPAGERGGVPVDLGERAIPSVVDCGDRAGIRTVVFFNWEDEERELHFSLGATYRVFDFRKCRYCGETEALAATLPPHESVVFHCSALREGAVGACDRMVPELRFALSETGVSFGELKPGERILCAFRSRPRGAEGCVVTRGEGAEGLYLVTAGEGGNARIRF